MYLKRTFENKFNYFLPDVFDNEIDRYHNMFTYKEKGKDSLDFIVVR